MTFREQLNEYIEALGCSAKELARAAEVTDAVLSRYRSGEREPDADSEAPRKLAKGIAALGAAKNASDFDEGVVYTALCRCLPKEEDGEDYARLLENLNALLALFDVSMADMAKALNFDPSFLSRIRSGQRKPGDMDGFVLGVCNYIVHKYDSDHWRDAVAPLLGYDKETIREEQAYHNALRQWLTGGTPIRRDYIGDFLMHLDAFDLNEYIRAIRFDEMKVPSVPFQLGKAKNYYGIDQMKQGELDFFKTTVLAKSSAPVFMYSNMPMEDMAEDRDFLKKWMFAIAMTLKKQLHLQVIHNVNRPFKEMMLGLESWIPLYMTGQVAPYHFKTPQNSVNRCLTYVSGAAALDGQCIEGNHDLGKYYLTNNKEEVAYYRRRSEALLKKAQPLMEIYRGENANIYRAFLLTEAKTGGCRRSILSSLPLYTMDEALLNRILDRVGLGAKDRQQLLTYAAEQREQWLRMTEENEVCDEITELAAAEFAHHPMVLSLAGAFYEKEIAYTYEEYQTHLAQTLAWAESIPHYSVKTSVTQPFRHIQITIRQGKLVLISKNKGPVIHFVIRHPKMVEAMENFVVPITD